MRKNLVSPRTLQDYYLSHFPCYFVLNAQLNLPVVRLFFVKVSVKQPPFLTMVLALPPSQVHLDKLYSYLILNLNYQMILKLL